MPASRIRLLNSTSEHNSIFTYVCLISNVKPDDTTGNFTTHVEDEMTDLNEDGTSIRLERSKAVLQLPEGTLDPSDAGLKDKIKAEDPNAPATSSDDVDAEKTEEYINPNILKLTRMHWLTESREGSLDARITTVSATQSISSYESEIDEQERCESERTLSTILRLDKEHNLFGLSNITIFSQPKVSRKTRREDDKAVFHQTAIIQVCYPDGCCRHRTSNTALPSSLKCGRCRKWCSVMPSPSGCPPFLCCNSGCGSCSLFPPCSSSPCPPASKCLEGPCGGGGLTDTANDIVSDSSILKIKVFKKPPYKETYQEVIPQSSCELVKPMMARTCHHTPRCIPPSSFFPYCMPCYWPARSTGCSEPAHCFHNPPCPRKVKKDCCKQMQIPCGKPCVNSKEKASKCENLNCIGRNNPALKDALAKFATATSQSGHQSNTKPMDKVPYKQ